MSGRDLNADSPAQLAEAVTYELWEGVLPAWELPAPRAQQSGRIEEVREGAHAGFSRVSRGGEAAIRSRAVRANQRAMR